MSLHNPINQETAQKSHEFCIVCINNIQIDPNFLKFINHNSLNTFYENLLNRSILDDQPFKKSEVISFSLILTHNSKM